MSRAVVPFLMLSSGRVIDGVDLASTGTKGLSSPAFPQSASPTGDKCTISVRYERTSNGSATFRNILLVGASTLVAHDASGTVSVVGATADLSATWELVTTGALFPNPTGPTHVMMTYDTTQAVAADRLRLWVDGVEITSFSTDERANIPLDADVEAFGNTLFAMQHIYGAGGTIDCDGVVGGLVAIDGLAITDPTVFDEVYAGSVGARGYHLDFADANDLGNDIGANGTDFTLNGVSAADHVSGWLTL